jgi:Outer membrane protein beta-barrel domain
MKKITKMLVAVCTLASVTFVANAQIKFGPVVGLNLANVSGDVDNNAMKLGLHIGGVVGISINDNLSVEPGIQFSMKGSQDSEESDFKTNAKDIDIPINLRYMFGEGSGFTVNAGPYVGILMSAKATDGEDDVDVKEFYNSTDFGVNVGIGYQLEGGLGFGAGYSLGLSNIVKDGDDFDVSVQNNAIQISVRYMLGGE